MIYLQLSQEPEDGSVSRWDVDGRKQVKRTARAAVAGRALAGAAAVTLHCDGCVGLSWWWESVEVV